MAVKWPLANGNWSAAANWNDGTKPTTGDTVHGDGKTVTIDENVDLGAGSKLTTETRSGGSAGGGFTFSGNYTITVADLVSNVASACLTYTGSGTGAAVNANGTASLNSATCIALAHTGIGTLTVVGNGDGQNNQLRAFQNSAGGIFNLTGNVINSVSDGYGVANNSTGTINLTGVASTVATGSGAGNLSTGTLNITGNPVSTSINANAAGANNYSTGAMNVTLVGTLAGSGSSAYLSNPIRNSAGGPLTIIGSVAGSAVNVRPTVLNQSTGLVTVTGTVTAGAANLGLQRGPALRNESTTRAAIGTLGDLWAVEGGFYANNYPTTTTTTVQLEGTAGETFTLYAPGSFPVAWSPAPANVRDAVAYENGTKTGTCHVPPAASVALNVPVDDTVGTLDGGTVTQGDIDAIQLRLAQTATLASVAAQLAAAGGVPGAMSYERRSDSTAAPLYYFGTAPAGTQETAEAWNITRLDFTSGMVETGAINVAWTDRATATYT